MKKVKFNRNVYSDSTIAKTAQAHQNHAVTSVKYSGDYAIVTFWKCKYGEDITIKEFENYMIGIENS